MALPMDNLMRLLVPNRTPPSGSAMPTIATAGAMPQIAPAAQAQPQLSPTAKYIADMQALMSGGVGPLSSGEKIAALGQVLQAAGSRGASDPAAVLQNVRQQQMQKLNAQYQIAQLQQKQQQEAAQRASIAKYKVALEPGQINALEGLPLEEQAKKVAEIAFRQDQVREVRRDADGNTVYVFTSGKSKPADFNLPKDFEQIQIGDSYKYYNKDNPNEYLKDASGKDVVVPIAMTAYQRESLGLRRQEIANAMARGGTEYLPRPTVGIIDGKPTYVQWDKKNQLLVPFTQPGLTAPTKGDIQASQLGGVLQGLLAGAGNIE